MGDPKGFLKVGRKESGYRPVEERLLDYSEVEVQLPEAERKLQASRCMDCGVPFCNWACPLGNMAPEWQEKVFKGDWKSAYLYLQETNCFPEFTGRLCPALCEASCVLGLNDSPVTIRENELSIIEKAFDMGLVKANPPAKRSGKKVAVVGGGPSGLACADILNKKGHNVVIFEAEDSVGGYLRFGIPDFKLSKKVIDRRVDIMKAEGVEIKTKCMVGRDVTVAELKKDFDAVAICIGARKARDLNIEGRELKGIHYALEYLSQKNKIVRGDKIADSDLINALNKNVVVVGGGDTGSDCVGTANRENAHHILQIELLPEPPKHRTENEPWPLWPKLLKTTSSHKEGCERMWNVLTKKFIGENGHVKKVQAVKVKWTAEGKMVEIPGTEFEFDADLVLLAMGFVHPVHEGLVDDLGVELDQRGNIKVDDNFMTTVDGVFAAGDAHRGAALIVWAIAEGRKTAAGIDKYFSVK